MTLSELSEEYQHSAQLIRNRIASLRKELRTATDPDVIWNLKRRIAELTPILTQMNEIADLTAHYYERSFHRNERYTL